MIEKIIKDMEKTPGLWRMTYGSMETTIVDGNSKYLITVYCRDRIGKEPRSIKINLHGSMGNLDNTINLSFRERRFMRKAISSWVNQNIYQALLPIGDRHA